MMSADEDLLADYVAAALDRRDEGGTVNLESLCAAHLHLVPAVAEALGMAPLLPGLHADSVQRDRWVGVRLAGRYELCERIGAGAMGAVYRARDVDLQREVAVKLLRGDLFAGPQAEQRFHREAQALAAVEHEHVVPVHDRGRAGDDGPLFLVMGWVRGASLARVLDEARDRLQPAGAATFARTDWLRDLLPAAQLESSYLRQCLRWGRQIAGALQAAHAVGIVHRDVKPSNVLVTEAGDAVLVDFGIAARAEDGMLTATGTSIGTPWYMAPEQAAGAHEAAPPVDVYGLGASLYHLLALRPPFDDEPMRVLTRVQHEDPPRIARLHPGLPRDVVAIIEHAMERAPEHRYADCGGLQSDLDKFLSHRPVSVRAIGPIGRGLRAVRRRPALTFAVVAGLALLTTIPLWSARVEAAASKEYGELHARLPALLTFESYPDKRRQVGAEERAAQLRDLDRMLELRPGDHGARLARMGVLQDVGRHRDAARDAEELVRRARTPFTQAVAARYASSDESVFGADALDLTELPEPETATDAFVAAFHVFRQRRNRDYGQAVEWLQAAGDYGPARDLLIVALLATGRFAEAEAEALRLEGAYGRPTARTRHIVGASRLHQGRYREAIEPLERSLALRPDRHGPLHNLGIAYLNLGDLDRASELFDRAHAIRPWLWNTLHEKSKLLTRRGKFDDALAWAERIPTEGTMGEAWKRPLAIARVLFHRTVAEQFGAGPAAAILTAGLALEHYDTARHNGLPRRHEAAVGVECAFLRTVQGQDDSALFDRFLEVAASDPLHPVIIRNLSAYVPGAGLSPEQARALEDFLEAQAERLTTDR